MHDCASHDIDVIRWIVREEPVEVFASGSAFIPRIRELGTFALPSASLFPFVFTFLLCYSSV